MAELEVSRVAVAEERVASERFFSPGRLVAVLLFLLFALTFDDGRVQDDGTVYFNFLRRAFGADTAAVAYQFGSSFWNAPFYLLSQLVATRGAFDHPHAAEVSVNVASNAAVVLTLYIGWRMLRELDLPRGPAVLLLTLFGTPLFFYGVLGPSYKHAADTLYATAAFWFALRSTKEDARRWDFVATGLCLALLLTTRYANVALIVGMLAVFAAMRLRRAAAWILATAAVASALAFMLPIVRHIPYDVPPDIYAGGQVYDGPAVPALTSQRLAVGTPPFVDPVLRNSKFSATAPLKMLFTLRRGLFVFTPLTAFATVGFILLTRRDRRHRAFLLALGVSAAGLVAIHSMWGRDWHGGGSFSERFLTALFPFFLLGTAELVRRGPRAVILPVLALCATWSLWIGLVQFNGYYESNGRDSIVRIVENFKSVRGAPRTRFHKPPPYDSLQNFGRQMVDRFTERWQLYWRLAA